MNSLFKITLAFALLICSSVFAFAQKPGTKKYKCMVQMTNYVGEEAYIVVSLINPKGAYEKTIYMMATDKEWYKDLEEWHKFQKKKPVNISAITGASVAGGDRAIKVFEIEDSKIDKGYTLRFEVAVEDKEYHVKDLEVPLTKANVSGKIDGKGYIRYVRMSPN
ncbi:DUF2271 domain-containing protein [Daejeonella lutea]|uniref:Flagellin biosynthesis protein FlgD n=1 Tax=Daejeonella lutea TaxID=572036 RepID=A0A1T5BLU2_9SPHI|nr:DUF2271 domain-containing protein [Daejeonella lutea]SKB48244.1 Predicted protein [Daejeonella lutea]